MPKLKRFYNFSLIAAPQNSVLRGSFNVVAFFSVLPWNEATIAAAIAGKGILSTAPNTVRVVRTPFSHAMKALIFSSSVPESSNDGNDDASNFKPLCCCLKSLVGSASCSKNCVRF